MTDRHIHCVYFQFDNPNHSGGYCLLKQKEIPYGFHPHCDKIVLRPMELLSYFLKHEHYCEDWECADKKALDYLEQVGFNTYPKKDKEDVKK